MKGVDYGFCVDCGKDLGERNHRTLFCVICHTKPAPFKKSVHRIIYDLKIERDIPFIAREWFISITHGDHGIAYSHLPHGCDPRDFIQVREVRK